jgi:hypothetical protein
LIGKVYRAGGFVLLGALLGSGLTLAAEGKLSAPDMVRGPVFLLGLAILVVNGRRNKALFFLAICLCWAALAVGCWMRGKLSEAIIPAVLVLVYAGSAWFEYGGQRKKRAGEIAQLI